MVDFKVNSDSAGLGLNAARNVSITRVSGFSAAHRLVNPAISGAENARIYGKCGSPNWHGHNYKLEVTVTGAIDPATGFIIDLHKLDAIIDTYIIRDIDHKNLNMDVPWLAGIIPTLENLVTAIWTRLADILPHESPSIYLVRIRLYETEHNFAECTANGHSE